MSAPVLELFKLSKAYGKSTIVKEFNLNIAPGEFVTLIGHSGCGKSTVLSMVAGLTPVTDGAMILSGRETTEAGPDRGVVFQSPCLLPWMTAFENVMLGVDQVYFTAPKAERRELAEYYLTVVGLGGSMHKYPGELSQGMRQRVGIARAFALQPKMLLLDEPFGMLDALTKMELQEVLLELWRRNKLTTLMVTHDVDEAIFLSDRVVMMTDGPEAEVGDILTIPFERPRDRAAVLADPRYPEIRNHLLTFLNERSHIRPSRIVSPEPEMIAAPEHKIPAGATAPTA
ncbi:ABC transporter ATP-binding protein [Luteolibacter flavescens]|uniref:ABC transporter ATP-binding protein n=1 Tax=Luteolibacter flavescens TaxID=1859460 RepID=A0ABT3FMK6_9BACT|nr:ABC transporter ATP-binding protein [Luteolibacter flavescens]MCW1884806.1 ABC transporter ATP-binding protein [Luteolibacter flavescens]